MSSFESGRGAWGRNRFRENLNSPLFMTVARVVRPIAPREPTLEEVFGAYWQKHQIRR